MNKTDPLLFFFQTPNEPTTLKETLITNLEMWNVPPQVMVFFLVMLELSGGDLNKLAAREELNQALLAKFQNIGSTVTRYDQQPHPEQN